MGKSQHEKLKVLFVATLLMLSSVLLAVLLPNQGAYSEESRGVAFDHQLITYYSNNGADQSYSVEYDGIASSEYNPEYWAGTFDDVLGASVQNWSGPKTDGTVNGSFTIGYDIPAKTTYTLTFSNRDITIISCTSNNGTVNYDNDSISLQNNYNRSSITGDLTIRASLDITGLYDKVFSGWNTSSDGTGTQYYPGDVVPNSVSELYATWTTPDLFENINFTFNGNRTVSDSVSEMFLPYLSVTSTGNLSTTPFDGSKGMYSTIYLLGGNISFTSISNLPTGTYRSFNVGSPVNVTLGKNSLSGGAIFDNLNLKNGGGLSGTHGDHTNYGLFANGKVLILGTNIGTDATAWNRTPQIVGGAHSDSITSAAVSNKTIVSNSSDNFLGTTVNLGTYVIIHSGIYQNIAAGGITSSVGSSSVPLSTYLVMKGGTVLDTVIGGSGGEGSYPITAVSNESSVINEKCGGTFVYLLGCNAPGDDYQEIAAGYRTYQYYVNNPVESIGESTIIEGGASSGTVVGSSHVFVSDDATVWDVQAGGRRSQTSTTFAFMEVSGKATIKHLACGTITDGNGSGTRNSVGGAHIVVEGSPKIASLFGAGYDTWTISKYSSFIGRAGGNIDGSGIGKIDVDVKGGTIGYVYGGGYRGTIGTADRPVDVMIDITGGTVLYDVFGGGRGGLEKVLHGDVREYNTSYGTIVNRGNTQTTGQSFVYGDIDINIDGNAVINGSVYGGGESVPIIQSYTGFDPSADYEQGVAKVVGDVTIDIGESAHVRGSVYGAGKGIELNGNSPVIRDLEGNVITDGTKLMTYTIVDASGEFVLLNWAKDGVGAYLSTSDAVNTYYLDYARVEGTVTVNIVDGQIDDDVYGGGAMSRSYGVTTVNMTSGNVAGDIYGGGLGVTTRMSGNQSTYANISGDAVVGGNVYGGAAYGLVSGASVSTNVTIGTAGGDTCVVEGSVYGGGKGIAGYESVIGANNVTINGGTIRTNAYGGSELGITTGNVFVTINGGNVLKDVFGGGKGAAGYDSVRGNTILSIKDGTVTGNVYAGSELGIITGNTYTTLSGGLVNGSVYGGGLGSSGNVSVRGKRDIVIDGVTILGSVYGGSSFGDDMSNGVGALDSNTMIIITSGSVGSVFGGGYKGATYGNTAIYIGYSSTLTVVSGKTISISGSIYGGGDVGELSGGDLPFTQTMVQGNTSIFINGHANNIGFSGSVFGSGNSCLTGGTAYIEISDLSFTDDHMMESIHRADRVVISGSDLYFEGRAPGVVSTKYSFYEIDDLSLKDESRVHLFSSMDNVQSYSSLNADGSPTMSSSPFNTICLHDGTVFDVKDTEGNNVTYGLVNGYTILSIITTESYYGAFAFGSLMSPGGFVIESKGTYVSADNIEFDNCRCWFISGVVQKTSSITMKYDPSAGEYITETTYIDLPKISSSTKIRYTGSYFTSSSTGSYSLVSGNTPGNGQYSVLMGADDGLGSDSLITFAGGQYMTETFSACNIMGTEPVPGKLPHVFIQVMGMNQDFHAFLGYVTITFQEVVEIQYTAPNGDAVTDYVIYNVGKIALDLYADGSVSEIPDMETSIDTVSGVGESAIHIPQNLTNTEIYLKSFTTTTGTPVTIQSENNRDNTNGWTGAFKSLTYSSSISDSRIYLGTLNGGYFASIGFSVNGLTSDSETYEFVFTSVSEGGVENDFNITVHAREHEDVVVTFVDSKLGSIKEYYFQYGSRISESDCPSTGASFVGWYMDEDFINEYNYNAPLTSNMTLYARYMYTVTFDNMNGSQSIAYVQIVAGGTLINKPTDPTWEGYEFAGWYQDTNYSLSWDFNKDKVASDVRLYAKWIGDVFDVGYSYMGMPLVDGSVITLKSGDVFTLTTSGAAKLYVLEGNTYAEYVLTSGTHHFDQVPVSGDSVRISTTSGDVSVFDGCMLIPGGGDSITLKNDTVFTISVWDSGLSVDGYAFNSRGIHLVKVGGASPAGTFANGDVITFTDAPEIRNQVRFGDMYGSSIIEATERAKALLGASDSIFKFVRWQIQNGSGQTVAIYSDTIVSVLPEKSHDEYLTQVLSAQFTDSAINVNLDTNTTDLDVVIEPPKSFLVFKSDDGKYRFSLNNATRIGYRIIGWAWESDATPSSASFKPIGSEWVLTGEETVGGKSIYDINAQGEKVITFYAIWERIEYTVTIVSPSGGTIVAENGGTIGTSFTVNYGEIITLNYIEANGWTFNKWYINGEGSITDLNSQSTTLVVMGHCAVYAQLKGLEDVTVNVYLDGGTSDPRDLDLFLRGPSSDTDLIWRENVTDSGRVYGVYKTTSIAGTLELWIKGSNGSEISLGDVIVAPGGIVTSIDLLRFADVPEHLGFPEYGIVGDAVMFFVDENYELKPLTSGEFAGQKVVMLSWIEGTTQMYSASVGELLVLPDAVDSAVTITANIGLVDRTVEIEVDPGFTIEPGTTTYVKPHGSTLVLPAIRDSSGHLVVRSTDATTPSNYQLVGWFSDPEYHTPFISGSTEIVSDMVLYPQIIEKSKVAYTVRIYQMGLDGTYPMSPITVVASDYDGQEITYVAPVYRGFTLSDSSSEIEGTIAANGLVLDLYYDRLYSTSFSVSYGDGAPVSGYDAGSWSLVGNTLTYIGKVYYGQTVELVSAERTGYTWNGWNIGGVDSSESSYTFDVDGTGNALLVPSIIATYTVNKYTLTMITPHGSFDGDVKSIAYDVEYGTVLGLFAPVIHAAEGYTFMGWEMDGVTVPNNMTMPAKDVTFIAVWILNTYELTYTGDSNVTLSTKANGNTVTSGAVLNHGTQIVLSMSFADMYSLGSYSVECDGESISLFDIAGNVSLPVQGANKQIFTWTFILKGNVDIDIDSEVSQHTVTYYLNGVDSGSGWVAPTGSYWSTFMTKNASDGVDIAITEVPSVAPGYVFYGWYSDQSMTSKITNIDDISDNVPIYGKVVPVKYTIKFDSNGGSGSMSDIEAEYWTDVNIVNGFTMANGSFLGWYCVKTDRVLGHIVSNLSDVDGGVVTLRAVWVVNTSVTFDGNYHHVGVNNNYGTAIWHYSNIPISPSNHGSHESLAEWHAGTYTIYVGLLDSEDNVLAGSATLSIDRKQLTDAMVQISGPYEYNGSIQNVIVDVTDSGFIEVGDYDVTGVVQAKDAGTYALTVTANDSGDYAGSVTKEWSIIPYVVALRLSQNTFTYHPDTVRSVSVIIDGIHGTDVVSAIYSGVTSAIEPGSYTINVTGLTGADSGNYILPVVRDVMWSITPANLKVTESAYIGVYDGNSHSPVISAEHIGEDTGHTHHIDIYYSTEGPLDGSNYSTRGSLIPVSRTNVCDITVYYYIVTEHTNPASGSVRINITPKSIVGSDVVMGEDPTYTGGDVSVNVTSVTIEGLPVTYALTQNTRVAVGTYKVSITGIGNFMGVIEHEWKVLPKTVTVTPAPGLHKIYGDADPVLKYTHDGVAGSIISGSLSRVAGEVVGTYAITLGTLTPDHNHVLVIADAQFEIVERTFTITGDTHSHTYNGGTQTITGTSVTNLLDGHTLSGISYSASGADVGTYPGTFSGSFKVTDALGNDVSSNYSLETIPGKLTIEYKSVRVTANDLTVAYGDAVSLSAKVEGTFNSDTVSFDLVRESGDDVGTYVITPLGAMTQGNYLVSYVKGTLTIDYRDVIVTTQSGSKTYGEVDPALSASVLGLIGSDEVDYTVTRAVGDNAGTYTIIATGEMIQGNYRVSFSNSGTFTINKATYDMSGIHFVNKIVVYDGKEHGIVLTDVNGDPIADLPMGLDGIRLDVQYSEGITNAGNRQIVATFSTTSGNYDVPDLMRATLEVQRASLRVETYSVTKEYDGTPITPTGKIEGMVNGETCGLVLTGNITDVGTVSSSYSIDWGTAIANNYVVSADIGTLEVTARAITITGGSTTVTYDHEYHEVTTFTADRLVDGHELYNITYLASGRNVGVHTGAFSNKAMFKVGDVDVTSNYSVTIVPGTLTISPRNISDCGVEYGSAGFVYDAGQHTLDVVQVMFGGHILDPISEYRVSGDTGTNAMDYKLVIEGIGNYTGSIVKAWTIAHAPVKVTANNASKVFGDVDPAFNATVTGLIGADTVQYVISRAAGENAGTYGITVTGASIQGNYAVEYVSGTFTIQKKDISSGTVTLGPSRTYNGTELTQTITSVTVGGMDVTYTVTGDKAKAAGNHTLTVTGSGNFTGSKSVVWNIAQKEIVPVLEVSTFLYDGQPKTVVVNLQTLVAGDVVQPVLSGTATSTAAGTYVVSVTGLSGANGGNYRLATVPTNLSWTISNASIAISVHGFKGTYDMSEHPAYVTATAVAGVPTIYYADVPLNDGNYSTVGSTTVRSFTDAGVYTTYYYVIAPSCDPESGAILTKIDKKPIGTAIITLGNVLTYNGTLQYQGIESVAMAPYTVTYDVSGNSATDAGSYTLTVIGNGNFTGSVTKAWTIQKATYDMSGVTFSDAHYTYDGTVKGLAVSGALPAGVTVSYSEGRKDVGSTVITATFVGSPNYNAIPSMQAELVINHATLTVTTPSKNKVYDGNALTADGGYTGLVNGETFTFATTGTITDVGSVENSYTITWNGTASRSNYAIVENLGTLTVTKATHDMSKVSFDDRTYTYDGTFRSIEIEGDLPAGIIVEYSSAMKDAGTYDMQVRFTPENPNYNDIAPMTAKMTILPKEITITSGSGSKIYDGTPLTVKTFEISGLVDGDQCIVNVTGSRTVFGEGNNTFDVSWGADTRGNNYVVTFNYGKLVVHQMDLTIYGETAEVVYNGGTITLSGISSTGLASGDTGSGLVYSATGKDVGTYGGSFTGIIEIRNAHGQVVTGSYNIVRVPGTLTIVPKALDASMVEITSGKLTYNATSQNVGFIVSDGTALVASDYTVEGFSGVDAKGYELVVTATPSGNYSGSVTVGWSIDKAPLTINGMVKSVPYNGAEQNARDVSAIGLMAGHTLHGILHNALGTNVGTYAGTFTGTLSIMEDASKEVASNYVVTYVPGSLTIEALDIDDAVVTQGAQLVYNGIARTPDIVSVKVGGLDVTYLMEYESKIDAGSYTLTVTGKGNFTGSKVVEWTIAKAPLTITAKDTSITYEDDAPVYDVVYNGFINGDNAGDLAGSLVLSCGYAPNAAYSATFDIVPSGLTSDNYDITFVKGTLTVSKKVIPIPVAVSGLIYEGEPLTGVPAGYGYGIVGNVKTNVGNYVANVTLLNQGYVWSDHTSVVKNIGWSIGKRTIMVTTPSDSKVYDGTPLTAPGTIINAIEGEYTFTTVGTITDAGSIVNGYSLVWAPGFSASNYSITENLGTLTVQKKEISVETYGETKVYDALVLDKGGVVNGLVAGESVTLNTPNTILNVGSVRNEYTITWDNAKESNYRIVSESIGTLKIEYRSITVSLVSGQTKVYGDADPAPFVVSIDGTAYPELIAFDVERDAGEDVGTYPVTVFGNEHQGNYHVSFVSGTFSITKRALTVTADDKNVVYTNAVPVYTATYNGFANGDDVSDLTGSLAFACGYASDAAYSDSFDIVPSGVSSDNYDITFVKGILTVSKKRVAAPLAVQGLIYNGQQRTGVFEGEGYTIDGTAIGTDAGDYDVTVRLKSGYLWNDGTSVDLDRDWSIAKRTVEAELDHHRFRYTGSALTVSIVLSNIVGTDVGDVVAVHTGTLTATVVGNYTVTVTGLDGTRAGNYALITPTIVLNWQIIEESLVVDAIPYHGIFDGNDHTITLSVDSAASITDIVIHYSVYSDFRQYTTTPIQFKDAGTHTVYYHVHANGHSDVAGSCNVVITKKPIVIDPYDAQKRFGSSDPVFSAKVTGTIAGYNVTYDLVREAGENAGNYTISVTNLSGIGNYDVTTLTGTFTIIPQALLSSMIESLQGLTYNGEVQTTTYSVVSGSTLLVKDTDFTVSGDSGKNAGTYTLIITGKGNYVGTVSKTWSIAKKALTIQGDSYSFKYNGQIQSIDTFSTDGLVPGHVCEGLTYHAFQQNLGSSSGIFTGTLVIKSGSDDVTSNYAITQDVGRITIEKRALSDGMLNVSGDYVYNGNYQYLSYVLSDMIGGVQAIHYTDYTVTENFGKDAGTYTLTITATPGGNYDGFITKQWQIAKRDISIHGHSGTVIYNGQEQVVSGFDVSNLVSGHVVSGLTHVASGTLAVTHAGVFSGTLKVMAGGADVTSNYNVIETVKGSLAILQKDISDAIVELSGTLTYNGHNQTMGIVSVKVDGLTVTQYNVAGNTAKDAGTYTMVISGNLNFTGQKNIVWSIEKKDITVRTEGGTHTYDGTAFTKGGSIIGFVDSENSYRLETLGTITDVGSVTNGYRLTWVTANSNNYVISEDLGTLVVVPRNIAGAIVDLGTAHTYDGNSKVQGIDSVTVDGLQVTYRVSGHVQVDAGTYQMTVFGTGNFTGSVQKDWQIAKRALDPGMVTVSGTYVYDGTAQSVTFAVDSAYPIVGSDYVVTGSTQTSAGVHTLTVTATAGGNYSGAVNVPWTIEKKVLEVFTPYAEMQYDGTALVAPDGTIIGAVTGDVISFTVTGSQTDVGSSVNTYTIVWRDPSIVNNYDIVDDLGTLTVKKRFVSFIGESMTVTYDGNVHTFDGIAVDGMVNGHTFDGLVYIVSGRDAGTYAGVFTGSVRILSNGVDMTSNYDVSCVVGSLVIEKRALSDDMLTIDGTYVFDGTDMEVSFEVSDNGDIVASDYTVTGDIGRDAGTYTLTIVATDGGNYSGSVSKTWSIGKRAVTVTGESDDREYNRYGHELNGYTVVGLIPGHHFAGLVYSATGIHVGSYLGEFSGILHIHDVYEIDQDDNYEVTLVAGTLNIDPLDITSASIDLGSVLVYNGQEQSVNIASVSAKGIIVLTYDVEGNTGTEAGTYTLKIIGTGDYIGEAERTWIIERRSILDADITLGPQLYDDGTEKVQGLASVKVDGMDVTYTVTGNTGTDAGSYSMTVVGVGNFIGTVHVPWTIEERIVISITVPTDEYLYTGDSQDVTIIVKDENGNDIPYHLEYFDMEGNSVEFKDVGRYTVRVVIDDSMYIIDGSSAFVVEIVDVPEPVEESFNIWLLFLVLFIAVLAAYLPLSYIFGFGFARWCIVLLPVALATILSMILGGILIIDTGGWLMVFEISIAAMSLYFPISYMRNK